MAKKMTVTLALRLLEKPLPRAKAADPCTTYRQVIPILNAVVFLLGWIPGLSWGKQAAEAIKIAMEALSGLCK